MRDYLQAPGRDGAGADVLPALAEPLLGLAKRAESERRPDPQELAATARMLVAEFEKEGRRRNVPPDWILDARDALVVLLDVRVRSNPALPIKRWERALAAALPISHMIGADDLAERAARAAKGGLARRDLARFLGHCSEAVQAAQAKEEQHRTRADRGLVFLPVALFFAVLVAWAGWAEWQFRERLLAQLPDVRSVVEAGKAATPAARAAQLDAFVAAVRLVEQDATRSPLGLIHHIEMVDPAAAARRRYGEAAEALVAEPLAEALAVALATEGEANALYDSLRALSTLKGTSDWQPRFLGGWVADRAESFPELALLAEHVAAMPKPQPGLPSPDPETIAQARQFAAEGLASERALLELARAEKTAAVPPWSLSQAAPGLDTILIHRSGLPSARGVPGLYTEAGWNYAKSGTADAIRRATSEAAKLLPSGGGTTTTEAVMDLLQKRTLEVWTQYLGELRVRAFTDQPTSVVISGGLSARNSPLSALIREAWRQSGGTDRSRSHANQLRVAAALGPAIQFVEQGRMSEISQLFVSLNVALSVLDADAEIGKKSLMDAQERANSIVALQQAPLLVVQIVEDVIAQTATPKVPEVPADHVPKQATSAPQPAQPSQSPWGSEVAAACQAAVSGHYPFFDGPDADMAEVARIFAPNGTIERYFRAQLAHLMDTSTTPWRWKPEARLSGYSPESAAFLQKAVAVGEALFQKGASPDVPIALEALAQRGAATVSIGGAHAPVITSGESVTLNWPGASPAQGFEISFDTGPALEKKSARGPWGLLRFLDGSRLRPREAGRRFLIDVRAKSARAYLQMSFAGAANPVSVRSLMRGLTCPFTL
ncbi:Type VI secretion system protein DotU [Rhizobium mongolense subsp. loessense]|uniref:Type VI secretion system protein DotU n=1 Tax=Rhizobium mongolense subsp. loessense TaxID=158890 RepID=A0A1G4TMI3_9HYPH|nr:ImcF-related family protein [Rhizobium mongolense]SCW82643.1 Type VI secretion system protein DotU [Rhizobium mongolense subsp. loessense]